MAEKIQSRDDVLSQLQQIFPNHSPLDIDGVITCLSAGCRDFSPHVINQCIDQLMSIKPRVLDDDKLQADKDELSTVQQQVIMELTQIFPDKPACRITQTVTNPNNSTTSYPVLLQRCLDFLLEDNTEDSKTSKGEELLSINKDIDELDQRMQQGSGSTGCVRDNSFGKTEYRDPNIHFDSDEDSLLFDATPEGKGVATTEGTRSISTKTGTSTETSPNIDKLNKDGCCIKALKEDEVKLPHKTLNNDANICMDKESIINVTSGSNENEDFEQTVTKAQLKKDRPNTKNTLEDCNKSGVKTTHKTIYTKEGSKNSVEIGSSFQQELSDTYKSYRQNNSPGQTSSSDASSSPDTPPHIRYCKDRLAIKNIPHKGKKTVQNPSNETLTDHKTIKTNTPVKLRIKCDPNSGFRVATPPPQNVSNAERSNSFKDYRGNSSCVSRTVDPSTDLNKVYSVISSPEDDSLVHPSSSSREKYKCFIDNENDRIKAVVQLGHSSASSSLETTADKNRNNSSDFRSAVRRTESLNNSKNEHKRKYMLMDLSSDSDSDEQTGRQGHLVEQKDDDDDLPSFSIKTKDRDRFIMSPARKLPQQKKQDSPTNKFSFSHYRDKGARLTEKMHFHSDTMPQRLPNTRFVAVGDASSSPQRPEAQVLAHNSSLENIPGTSTGGKSGNLDEENKPTTVLIESTCKITYSPNLFRMEKGDGIKQVPPVSIPSLIPHIPVLNDVPNVAHFTKNLNNPSTKTHMASNTSNVTETTVPTRVDPRGKNQNIQRQNDAVITFTGNKYKNHLHNDPEIMLSNTSHSNISSIATAPQASTVQRAANGINKSTLQPEDANKATVAEAIPNTSKQDVVNESKTVAVKDNELGIVTDPDDAEAVTIDSDDMGMDLDSDFDDDVLLDDELEVMGVEREVEVIDDDIMFDDIQYDNFNAQQPRQPRQKQKKKDQTKTQEEVIADLKNEVLQLFPDVDQGYLETLCNSHHGPMASNNICAILLDNQYPRKQIDKHTPGSIESSKDQVMIDYLKHNQNKLMSRYGPEDCNYRSQSEAILFAKFPLISAVDIRRVIGIFEYSYAMTHRALQSVLKQAMEIVNKDTEKGKNTKLSSLKFDAKLEKESQSITVSIKLLKNRRYMSNSHLPRINQALQREVDFVERKQKEMATEQDHEFAKQLNEQEYEAQGQCIECGCCYGEIPFDNMVQCLEGHLFCEDCLRQYARESVFGQGKAQLSCMTEGCNSAFPKNQLEKALPSDVLLRYEDRVAEENLNLADIGDLVRCPHCDFAAIMDPDDKVFRCMNDRCKKETCRHCKEDWREHFGKKCEEIEQKGEVKLRLEYEEKMTKAKVRTCHRCKAQFMKEDGCNKMTCRCGAKMCYICRKPDIDYNHFCRHPRDPGKACMLCNVCSLWTNPEEDDNRAVSEIQKEAAEARKTKGYTEDKVIGVPEGQEGPPAKKLKK